MKHFFAVRLRMIASCCLFMVAGTSGRNYGAEAGPSYDFSTPKNVDEEAGAWNTSDGRCMVFFFTDHTVMQICFSETFVGSWRYTKSKMPKGIKTLEFQQTLDGDLKKAVYKRAWIDGDVLFISEGDYANQLTRMRIHRTAWEKGK